MAQKVMIELIDDIDGNAAEHTVQFGLDGTAYEIDLSEKNTQKLRKALAPFVEHARRMPAGKKTKKTNTGVDAKAVRAWARDNGIEVPDRGRIPADVKEQYVAAS